MRNTRDTKLLFELSEAGPPRRTGCRRATCRSSRSSELLPAGALAAAPPALPELARAAGRAALREPVAAQHVRRHALLSARLVHDEVQPEAERAARRAAGLRRPASAISRKRRCRACCSCSTRCRSISRRSPACDACSLQPAAGAHGELTALLVAAAYFRDRGEKRTKVLVPDSAHGTNPASAAMAGFETVTVKSNAERHRRSGRLPAPSSTTRSPCS